MQQVPHILIALRPLQTKHQHSSERSHSSGQGRQSSRRCCPPSTKQHHAILQEPFVLTNSCLFFTSLSKVKQSNDSSLEMFCPYKHIFGKERQGFHSLRLLDIAIGDLVLTILGAYAVSYALKTPFLATLLTVLVIGIIVHRLFCVNTKINTLVFGVV